MSVPIVEDRLGVTLSGFYEDSGGLVDRINPATGSVIKENADASESYGFSGDLLFQATEELDVRIKVLHQKVKYDGTSAVELADLNKTPTYDNLSGIDQLSRQHTEQDYLSATLNYDLEWATLTATSSYVKYEVGAILDYTAIFSDLADTLQGNPLGTTTDAPFSSPISSEKYAQEVRLTSEDSDVFEWMAGLYYAEESTTQDQLLITQPGDFLMALASFPSEYKEYAAFANLTYYVTPDFDLTAGMRYADTTMELKFITDGPLVGGPSDPATESLPTAKANIQTYLFTARYRPNEDMSLYARIASGYRPASANLTVVNPITQEPASKPIVDQDNLWSYEIGVKGNLVEGLFSYDMSLWYLDWSNFQAPVSLFGTSALGNAADGITAKGFEGAFSLRPTDGFIITSTVAYTHSTLNEDEEELNGLKGQFVPNVPQWTASTRANYDFDISSDMMGNVGAGFRYVQGSPSAFDDGDLGDSAINIPSDSYFLVDMNASVQMDNISLNFYVTNLFNKSAFANVIALLIPGAPEVSGQPIPLTATGTPVTPRTFGAVLSFDF
ncbi:MAG: TonB-dependent receptor [Emcibacter sp.]|nr:TonB-dependent receptor [Emcibacter sp.]